MSASLPVLHLAQVTLETATPLSVATGASDPLFDTLLARDANDLPMIPGTSLAGVLRHLYHAAHGRDAANALFGIDAEEIARRAARRDRNEDIAEEASYEASLLQVSSAALHDSLDRPVMAGPIDLDRLNEDPILAHALSDQPIERDHVKLTDRGIADVDQRVKFTRAALARGNRFSFELALWSDARPDRRWPLLRGLLEQLGFRLGGGTRRGFGEVKMRRWRERVFDLSMAVDAEAYRAFRRTADGTGFGPPSVEEGDDGRRRTICATLELEPDDYFRFGAGTTPLGKGSGKIPDMMPLSEPCVVWQPDGAGGERGTLSTRRAVIPASAIKGAIRHRVAFHYNRSQGRFLEDGVKADTPNQAAEALFGPDLGPTRDKTSAGRAGLVIFSDLLLDDLDAARKVGRMTHNGIDRFTGGTRRGVLYSEELLFGAGFRLSVDILAPNAPVLASAAIRQALDAALRDLAEGRLALGAGASKGHGYFMAPRGVVWSDGGSWVRGDVHD